MAVVMIARQPGQEPILELSPKELAAWGKEPRTGNTEAGLPPTFQVSGVCLHSDSGV